MLRLNVEQLRTAIKQCDDFRSVGKLRSARNLLTASFPASVGDVCQIRTSRTCQLAEVIGFDHGTAQILPYEPVAGLHRGARVVGCPRDLLLPCDEQLLGRTIDGLGRPNDGGPPIRAVRWTSRHSATPDPLARPRVTDPLPTGQRAIDALLTCGVGQRIGLFAGSGVGKSTLLGEIAKYADAEINVIALIGERGREVRPFLEDCVGPDGMQKSVAVVSTSDETPMMRVRAAETAVAIAGGFRAAGRRVLLLLDSMTRVATAQREIGLQLGEPPSSRGYTPSVFQRISSLLECLGNDPRGSISAILTVLVDGDDMDEPVADAVRATVDGHIVLNRELAERGHFPAIDISASISRVARDVVPADHQDAATKLRRLLATYDSMSDMIRLGVYKEGSSAEVDSAVRLMPAVNTLLRQRIGESSSFQETQNALKQIAAAWQH